MVKIRINGDERHYDVSIEPWINQQVDRRRADNQIVCTQVTINNDVLNMILQTSGCEGSATSHATSRRPTNQEQRIYDLWNAMGLNDLKYTGAQLVAFLAQLRRNS